MILHIHFINVFQSWDRFYMETVFNWSVYHTRIKIKEHGGKQ